MSRNRRSIISEHESPARENEVVKATSGRETETLLSSVYTELRTLAERRLAKEMPGQTLTATALVHETYLRLCPPEGSSNWDSTAHFFGSAAEAMRRILIDNARRKTSVRRGGNFKRIDFGNAELSLQMTEAKAQAIIDLNDSLAIFEKEYPKEAHLVKLRFFAGLTMDEISDVMEITRRTAQRYWAFAKSCISQIMQQDNVDQSAMLSDEQNP